MDSILVERLSQEDLAKLNRIQHPGVAEFVAKAIERCRPSAVMVFDDSPEDVAKVRRLAIERGEERPLALEGHTVHFDGYHDQARDKARTKYLVPPGMDLGENLLSIDRDEGLAEMDRLLDGIMSESVMLVRFFNLGPIGSEFGIPCLQITDSAYVAHSEDILYRQGYSEFLRLTPDQGFFKFLHSAGRLGEDKTSLDVEDRRIYIDLVDETVYSVNTQYAGNTVGLKKLAHRLAIRKAAREGWLSEHMLVMGVHGPEGRVSYFTGAFPSACGKTSTAMLPGQTIVGDDLAYLRRMGGEVRACNVESGIFGIIRDVNRENDPLIWDVLTRPGEVIFSNVLVSDDGVPYWLGDGREHPEAGYNHSGRWYRGKRDEDGNEIPIAHKNARYTIRISELANRDPMADDPSGVVVKGVVYGGRDSDTWPPIEQSFDWAHGVVMKGASLESETTAATLGQEGVRKFNIMSNLDFLSMPMGEYIQMHLDFVRDMDTPPVVFGVNYFLRGRDGRYLNTMADKRVWIQWAELRVNGDVGAIRTPCGYIPLYRDLASLFQRHLGATYTEEQYREQFSLRIPQRLAKIERIREIYVAETTPVPAVVFELMDAEHARLRDAMARHGEVVPPEVFATT